MFTKLVTLSTLLLTVNAAGHFAGVQDHHWGARQVVAGTDTVEATGRTARTLSTANTEAPPAATGTGRSSTSTVTARATAATGRTNVEAALSALPLTQYTYAYADVPDKVNPYVSERGPQAGTNICNSTTAGDDAMCQTLIVNSLHDFCLWGAELPNSVMGDIEGGVVAYCTNNEHGARLLPAGTFTGIQFMRTPAYIQITAHVNLSGLNFAADDTGGELDPHGADLLGNPVGGLLYSTGLPSGDNKTYIQGVEWNQFNDGNTICIKVCDPTVTKPFYCQNKYDILGCAYNMPAAYEDNVFLDCEGDVQDPVGIYSVNGVTSTWSQPSELPAGYTLPYTPRVPASSKCTTYQSSELFAAATRTIGVTSSSATSTSTSSGTSKATTTGASTTRNNGDSSSAGTSASSAGAAGATPTGAASSVRVGGVGMVGMMLLGSVWALLV